MVMNSDSCSIGLKNCLISTCKYPSYIGPPKPVGILPNTFPFESIT